jgi:putative acetyltransferase
MTSIRGSRAEDVKRVLEIWRDAVDATHDFLTTEDRAAIEKDVREFLPSVPLWLAVDSDDRPIGFMMLDGAHMDALFVDPALRGQGVGRALVMHALSMHPSLTTDVNEQNEQARRFYERLGFTPTGRSERDGQGRAYPLIHLKRPADS